MTLAKSPSSRSRPRQRSPIPLHPPHELPPEHYHPAAARRCRRVSPVALGRGKLSCCCCCISPTKFPSGALAARAVVRVAFSFRDGLLFSLSPCGDRLSAPSAGAKVLLAVVIRRSGPACWRCTVPCWAAAILQTSTPETATPTARARPGREPHRGMTSRTRRSSSSAGMARSKLPPS